MDLAKIKKELPGVEENVPLKKHTTFKIGGLARFFYVAEMEEDLLRALRFGKKTPLFLMGGGSNTLASDKGFSGLVIKTRNSKIKKDGEKVRAEAGAKLRGVVNFYLENGLSGLSWASGIPGTLGGAIKGNAGAFGSAMGESVISVRVFDLEKEEVKVMDRSDCAFGEKDSCFRGNDRLVILSAELEAGKGEKEKMKEKIMENMEYRFYNHPMSFPSAGCIFRNLEPEKIKDRDLFEKYPLLQKFEKRGIVPTGYLIEKAGLKGKRIGNAKISEKHANFIINLGGASSKDVVRLIKLAKKKVKKKFGVEIEEEITYLGF